jgi:DNA repair and recombination RAD54-like protein
MIFFLGFYLLTYLQQPTPVLIISYDLFRMNSKLLRDAKQIGLLVVDEGHRLKNASGSLTMKALQSLQCEARLLITGTPIQNNLKEFFTVANFVCPGLLGDIASFRKGTVLFYPSEMSTALCCIIFI